MLTAELRDRIESIQKRACRIIFGWDCNYHDLLSEGKIESLSERRKKLTLNFARKSEQNERFKSWFPRRNYNGVELRNEMTFEEQYARTDRLKNSPLYFMRREMNKTAS